MTLDDAISMACADAGISPPTVRNFGKWMKADTFSGKNGKGDGRVLINDFSVIAHNWQTGMTVNVSLTNNLPASVRSEIRQEVGQQWEKRRAAKAKAEASAASIIKAARMSDHPYLARKGFPVEKVLTIDADGLRGILGGDKPSKYLIAGDVAIIMPARNGRFIQSLQLIWEDGTKKFLFGGAISGSSHRLCAGSHTWLCEGLATGLSLRLALRGIGLSATVLCCFSASNVGLVASAVKARGFIAADNDKPIPQYDGRGAGQYFAEASGKPYTMPVIIGDDFNDMHQRDGIFAVQRHITDFLREARMTA
ncbi:MAG: hypothetical protein JWM58_3294 [Rhizobium sp.]|nr:hypothetical protein [Rhizobium sp.]